MFSAGTFLAKHIFPPKNGPVPSQPASGYRQGVPQGEYGSLAWIHS
jgi:hypothetical protein